VEHSIVWDNCAGLGGSEIWTAGGIVELVCSDVRTAGVEGGGTVIGSDFLDADPLFCDPFACASAPATAGDYRVASTSPALLQPCGAMGVGGAACAVAVEPTSWGSLKALYR
jgi:hypothetical protein